MPIKCESCRHFGTDIIKRQIFVNGRPTGQHVNDKQTRFCKNLAVTTAEIDEMFPARHGMPIDMAREICDREGDGIFVYFEPKEPQAGSAFARTAGVSPALPTGVPSPSFVQVRCSDSHCNFTDVFEPDELGITYYQAVGKCQLCSADTVYEDGTPTRIVVTFAAVAGGAQ